MGETAEVWDFSDELPATKLTPLAEPWARFWAKMIDLWLAAFVVLAFWLGAIFVLAKYFPAVDSAIAGAPSSVPPFVWNFLMFAATFAVDALIQATFGTTLGLKIVGARLEKVGHGRLSLPDCLQRNLSVLIFGFWLGFLAFIPIFLNYRTLMKRELVPWDQTQGTRIYSYHGNLVRTWLAALMFFALVAANIAFVIVMSKLAAQA